MRRRGWIAAAGALLLAGCGSEFELPTETPKDFYPSTGSYQLIEIWSGVNGVRDILLTHGTGKQLFLVFNTGGSGTAPRGSVRRYPRFTPVPGTTPSPVAGITFNSVFSPIAIARGGDKLFVLDEGDTALARDPLTHRIQDFSLYWRVRAYRLLGGDTLTSADGITPYTGLTDSTVGAVKGIAADDQGNVYLACVAVILVPDQNDPRIFTREFQSRIYRYAPGPLSGGQSDPRLPGSNWHRDDAYVVVSGTGTESVNDPRGLYWGAGGGVRALYVSDFGNNAAKKLSSDPPPVGYAQVDRDTANGGLPFVGAEDVYADPAGFFYVVDPGNRRVLRFDADGGFVKRVDQELKSVPPAAHFPTVAAAEDSLVYVWSRETSNPSNPGGRVLLYRLR